MKKTPRWMTQALKTSKTCDVQMPWARGQRRTVMIERRTKSEKQSHAA